MSSQNSKIPAKKKKMTIEEMEKELDTIPPKIDRRRKPTSNLVPLAEIAKVVTEAFPDGKGWDKTKNRESKYAKPRKVFCYAARELGWTLQSIGFFIGFSHESIISQHSSFRQMVTDWEGYQAKFGEVFEKLGL